jgi:protein-disulfide isomerase
MEVSRRVLLLVVVASPALAASPDLSRSERGMGNPRARLTAVEYFSLTCSHCADFALHSLPEIKARWIDQGHLRWVFYDFPTDKAALQAAAVARYLPPDRYERFLDTLFANQDRWLFGAGSVADALWPMASETGMDRATFDAALADTGLQDWIVGRALEAEHRWHVDATPTFLINGRRYTGAMSADEFAKTLGG